MAQEALSHIKPQQIGARQISGSNLNKAYDSINWLLRMAFDPSQFRVSKTAAGMSVSLSKRIPEEVIPRWKLTKYSYQSITVGDGTIRKAQASVAWSSSDGADVTGMTAASTTYYIYAKLASASGYDAGVRPESVTIESSTVWPIVGPPDDSASRRHILLGWVTTDSNGAFSQDDIVQVQFSDYNVAEFIPDGSTEKDDTTAVSTLSSLEVTGDGFVQIYQFQSGAATTPGVYDTVLFRYTSGGFTTVAYAGATNLAQWLADYASSTFWNDADWTTAAAAWLGTLPTVHSHATHTSFNDDSHNVASTVPYMLMNANGTATRNACHANVRLGDASNNASINPAGRTVYNTDGTTAVLTWDLSAWLVYFSATNRWNSTQFLVDASGAVTLDAGAALTLIAGTASTWTFTDSLTINLGGSVAITSDDGVWKPKENGNKHLFLGETVSPLRWSQIEANAYNIKLYGAGSGSLYLGGPSVFAYSNIYFNGVAGVDITNWTTKGGLTGTGVTAMTIQVPDGSGGTKDIEVLARAL
jgi:hypothetical protein